MKKVGFCFLAHQAHIRHQLPIAAELSSFDGFQVDLLVTTISGGEELEGLLRSKYPNNNCNIVFIKGGWLKGGLGKLKGRLYPNIRNVIKKNKKQFMSYDALVTPHHNLEQVMVYDKEREMKYICVFHGAGDGKIGFDKKFANYDLLLAAGSDIIERFEMEGLLHDGNEASVVGYPKLELLAEKQKLFDNDNPVFLYNPHYAKGLESWSLFGREVLDFFAKRPNYNLIFAPHVKLFKKSLPSFLSSFREYPNIIVDASSGMLMDATYTQAADVYIGDCSSQVYEFLYFGLKPVLFLDAHCIKEWSKNPNYKMWRLGRVVVGLEGLSHAIDSVFTEHELYVHLQKIVLSSKFSKSDESAGRRGAKSILNFLAPGARKEF
jgi:hypothetical protein